MSGRSLQFRADDGLNDTPVGTGAGPNGKPLPVAATINYAAAADGVTAAAVGGFPVPGGPASLVPVMVVPMEYNGTTLDLPRSNIDTGALITAVGATTTQTTADQINRDARGAKVVLNTTNIGTGSVTVHIQGKDTASGVYYDILVGAAVITNTTVVYEVYPGLANAANSIQGVTLPRTWRVQVVANNANAATYTVGASVIK